jgi:hypothetical protein
MISIIGSLISRTCSIMFLGKILPCVTAMVRGIANCISDAVRRARERDRLGALYSIERQDLGLHRVREELDKWPWQP